MGTILESTKELAKRFGVETEEQTIKDQLDAINKSIDENFGGSVDIAEAVSTYSKNASGGGGGGETFEFSVTVTAEKTGEEQMPTTLVSDKTYSEIVSAFNNGDKLVPTITINIIDGGETYTSLLTVALCTVTEQGLWFCGHEDLDAGINSIIWVENATTGLLVMAESVNVCIVS